MKVTIIVIVSLLFYYLGLVLITKQSFKRKNIDLDFRLSLFIPFTIIKTFINIALKNKHNKAVRKKVILGIFLDYSIALSILVEVVEFGISKNHIKQSTNEEKISILQKIGYLWKQGKLKASFSDSLGEYIFAR